MKRIAIVSEYFHPHSVADAIRMKVFYQVLDSAGYEVHCHCCTKPVENYRIHPTYFGPIPKQTGPLGRLVKELLNGLEMMVRLLIGKYDLLVITSPPFFMSVMAVAAARLKGVDYIYDVRDPYPGVFFAYGLIDAEGRMGRWLHRLECWIYEKAVAVTVASESMAENIRKRVRDPEKILVLLNGYSRMLFEARNEKEPVADTFTVVFHGNLGRFQDPEMILRLAKACQNDGHDIRFEVIGDGARDDCFREHGLDNLVYLGRRPHEEIAGLLAKSDLGVSFRTEDEISKVVFPVKIFEYLGAGLPVLVTPISEGGHFVAGHGFGYQFSSERFRWDIPQVTGFEV